MTNNFFKDFWRSWTQWSYIRVCTDIDIETQCHVDVFQNFNIEFDSMFQCWFQCFNVAIFQYIYSETLNTIQCQCWFFQCNVDLLTFSCILLFLPVWEAVSPVLSWHVRGARSCSSKRSPLSRRTSPTPCSSLANLWPIKEIELGFLYGLSFLFLGW